MNLTKCNQGHFYDADKDAICPHCAAMNMGGDNVTVRQVQDAPMAPPVAPPMAPPVAPPIQSQGFPVAQPITPPSFDASAGVVYEDIKTEPIVGFMGRQNSDDDMATESLESYVEDSGKTISIFNTGAGKNGGSYTVGWLVAVAGPHKGDDFRIIAGKNFIGRNASMDICLKKDNSVSREKQSAIIFDPNDNIFLIQEGESTQLTYLNGSLVLSAKELKAYDKIKLGKTELVFIPLCSADFSWENFQDETE